LDRRPRRSLALRLRLALALRLRLALALRLRLALALPLLALPPPAAVAASERWHYRQSWRSDRGAMDICRFKR
jgi:hypothetical protein